MEKIDEFLSIIDGIKTRLQKCDDEEKEVRRDAEAKLAHIKAEKARLEKLAEDESQVFSTQTLGEVTSGSQTAAASNNGNVLGSKSKDHHVAKTPKKPKDPETTAAGASTVVQSTRIAKSSKAVSKARNSLPAQPDNLVLGKHPRKDRASLPNPKTKSTPESQAASTRPVKAFSILSVDFPTIVRSADNDCWVDLRCYICGSNTKKSGEPLRGAFAFILHLKAQHNEPPPAGADKWHQEFVLRTCSHHQLSAEEAQGLLDGTPGAYLVPMVKPSGTEKKAIQTAGGHGDNDDDFIDDAQHSDTDDDTPLRLSHSVHNGDDDDDVVVNPRYRRKSLSHSDNGATPSVKLYLGARKSAPSLPPKRSLEADEVELDPRKVAKTVESSMQQPGEEVSLQW